MRAGPADRAGPGGATAATKDDDSLVGRLVLPVGIGAGVLLLGGIAFYALRRRGGA
ncbi:hypothetical protein ACFUJR_09925 [Streptomyces sp. NPDC057271]|uniref:hypothetical protein n=1 Tax=unclassified Streptomyces TaxID=2593676 RepID=UPI003645900D